MVGNITSPCFFEGTSVHTHWPHFKHEMVISSLRWQIEFLMLNLTSSGCAIAVAVAVGVLN